LSVPEQVELDAFIKEHMETRCIRPSKSPWASPFFFVKKKDGKLQPVQDYRKLNSLTIKNQYLDPLISEIMHMLQKATWFTKLDVRWGYNNIQIKEGDEEKASFMTNRGLWESLVMFFGLTNSPVTFQSMMNEIFGKQITEGRAIVYLDDILIYSDNLEDHRATVHEVLQVLEDNDLSLKHEKCEFEQREVEHLGVIIGDGKIRMDPVKVARVREWAMPKTVKDVQSFLGFLNFYRWFIDGFGDHAKPLTRLTWKDTRWRWGMEENTAFRRLIDAVTAEPVLHFPTHDGEWRVEADSSDFTTGACLTQCQAGVWVPIAFLSKGLNDMERNYNIHEEMLAVMH
jgi:hypothetical protein